MRAAGTWIVAGLLSGCAATQAPEDIDFAEIDVTVAPECSGPSAFVREMRSSDGQQISAKRTPVRIRPGVYSIGVSCGVVFDNAAVACVDASATSSRSDVAPYELVLQTQRRYVFSCSLVKEQNVIRLSESAL